MLQTGHVPDRCGKAALLFVAQACCMLRLPALFQTPPLLDQQTCLPVHLSQTAADLVFIQNGMLQPWLDERGLGDATQVRSAGQHCSWCGVKQQYSQLAGSSLC